MNFQEIFDSSFFPTTLFDDIYENYETGLIEEGQFNPNGVSVDYVENDLMQDQNGLSVGAEVVVEEAHSMSSDMDDDERVISDNSDIELVSNYSSNYDDVNEGNLMNNMSSMRFDRNFELQSFFSTATSTFFTRSILRRTINSEIQGLLESYMNEYNISPPHLILHSRGDEFPRNINEAERIALCLSCNIRQPSVLTLCKNSCLALCDSCSHLHFSSSNLCYKCNTPYLFGIKINYL